MRHRDMLKERYGVDVYFPRGNVRGAHQDMVLKGGVSAIFSARKEIAGVLHTWSEEYSGFKERKARRYRDARVKPVDDVRTTWPSLKEGPAKVKKVVSKNAFAVLLDEEGTSVSEVEVVRPAKTKKAAVLKGWATMVKKAPVPEAKEAKKEARVREDVTTQGEEDEVATEDVCDLSTMNWGDFADEYGNW